MAKKTKKKVVSARSGSGRASSATDQEGVYILKLALYVIVGSLWVKVTKSGSNLHVPIPIGLIIGLIFTARERFRMDRKIEYAVLVVAALFGFLAPYGLFVNL
ncbi:MAG: hypothetical protein WAQ24_04395 [Candidatus Saccharimonadales bacterium]